MSWRVKRINWSRVVDPLLNFDLTFKAAKKVVSKLWGEFKNKYGFNISFLIQL